MVHQWSISTNIYMDKPTTAIGANATHWFHLKIQSIIKININNCWKFTFFDATITFANDLCIWQCSFWSSTKKLKLFQLVVYCKVYLNCVWILCLKENKNSFTIRETTESCKSQPIIWRNINKNDTHFSNARLTDSLLVIYAGWIKICRLVIDLFLNVYITFFFLTI